VTLVYFLSFLPFPRSLFIIRKEKEREAAIHPPPPLFSFFLSYNRRKEGERSTTFSFSFPLLFPSFYSFFSPLKTKGEIVTGRWSFFSCEPSTVPSFGRENPFSLLFSAFPPPFLVKAKAGKLITPPFFLLFRFPNLFMPAHCSLSPFPFFHPFPNGRKRFPPSLSSPSPLFSFSFRKVKIIIDEFCSSFFLPFFFSISESGDS